MYAVELSERTGLRGGVILGTLLGSMVYLDAHLQFYWPFSQLFLLHMFLLMGGFGCSVRERRRGEGSSTAQAALPAAHVALP